MRVCAWGLVVLLAGCGGATAPSGPPSVEAEYEGGQEALDAEASANAAPVVDAGDVAEWENGLTAQITSVVTGAASESQNEQEGHDAIVHLTVEITNNGDAVFAFDMGPNGPSDDLYYGENLHEANAWVSPDAEGVDALPKQLVPGSSASYTAEWSLPGEGLELLTFEFSPASAELPTYTFTGVETLIA